MTSGMLPRHVGLIEHRRRWADILMRAYAQFVLRPVAVIAENLKAGRKPVPGKPRIESAPLDLLSVVRPIVVDVVDREERDFVDPTALAVPPVGAQDIQTEPRATHLCDATKLILFLRHSGAGTRTTSRGIPAARREIIERGEISRPLASDTSALTSRRGDLKTCSLRPKSITPFMGGLTLCRTRPAICPVLDEQIKCNEPFASVTPPMGRRGLWAYPLDRNSESSSSLLRPLDLTAATVGSGATRTILRAVERRDIKEQTTYRTPPAPVGRLNNPRRASPHMGPPLAGHYAGVS